MRIFIRHSQEKGGGRILFDEGCRARWGDSLAGLFGSDTFFLGGGRPFVLSDGRA